MKEDEKLYQFFEKEFELEMERSPITATFLGYKHEKYDHLLPNGSLEAQEEEIMITIQQKRDLEKIDYETLSQEGKLDYDLLMWFLNLQLFGLVELASWRSGATAGGPIGNVAAAIHLLYSRDFAPLETRVKAIISRLHAAPRYLEETTSRWQFPVKLWTELAIEEGQRTPAFLQLIQQTLQPSLDEVLHAELVKAIEVACDAFQKYTDWIKEDVLPRATHKWTIGPQKFSRLIELRKFGKTPEEILEIGEKALEDTKKQLEKLANELEPGKSVEEVREAIKSDHPPTFEMVLEHITELTKDTRKFILENDLMDVPEGEKLQVIPTPSFLIPIIPFAAYMSAEKFSKNQVGQYIVTPLEGREEMLKQHSYASCKNVAVHEGYPGHHLQIVSANLQPNLIRSIVNGTETIEGWAHYCEQLMAEKGFLGKKEVFSQLVDQLWRAVRIIVDVKLHTGQMTFDEAKEFMIKEIGMNENAVMAELKRYTATPSQPLSYLIGKFMLLEVRDEVREKMGEKYTDKFFHNVILDSGGFPIHFLRRLYDLKISQMVN